MEQDSSQGPRDPRDISVNVNLSLPEQYERPEAYEPVYKDLLGYGLWCLCIAGLCGAHRIYMGKWGTGLLWLFTFGLAGVGQLVDLFRMKGMIRDANVRKGYLPHPRFLAQAGGASGSTALPEDLRLVLLRAAEKKGGDLTVTQGVMASGKSFEEVEKCLRGMVDQGYVDVDNAPGSGVIVYRFPELSGE